LEISTDNAFTLVRKSIVLQSKALAERMAFPQFMNDKAKLAGIAEAMAHSPRSLQQRLSEEQRTFMALIDSSRRDLVLRYLSDRSLSLTERLKMNTRGCFVDGKQLLVEADIMLGDRAW
jgi:hypothetical protein